MSTPERTKVRAYIAKADVYERNRDGVRSPVTQSGGVVLAADSGWLKRRIARYQRRNLGVSSVRTGIPKDWTRAFADEFVPKAKRAKFYKGQTVTFFMPVEDFCLYFGVDCLSYVGG